MNCTVGFVSCFVSSLACVGSKAKSSRYAGWYISGTLKIPRFIMSLTLINYNLNV